MNGPEPSATPGRELSAPSLARAHPLAPSEARALCILVVDDNRDAADSLGLMLSAWGHRPLVAYDAAEAWELAVSYRPAVGLLDLRLPGTSGWDLARRLRGEPSLVGMRLFALTGYGRDIDRQKSAEAGIDLHLVKPVEPDLLRGLLVGCGQDD